MERAIYRKILSSGPGGIKCPCCRPAGCYSVKAARIAINRYNRRVVAKAEIKNAIAEQEN